MILLALTDTEEDPGTGMYSLQLSFGFLSVNILTHCSSALEIQFYLSQGN